LCFELRHLHRENGLVVGWCWSCVQPSVYRCDRSREFFDAHGFGEIHVSTRLEA
jgi:hypothetical protein